MKSSIKLFAPLLLLLVLALNHSTALGHTWVEVESNYLGNGCFKYRIGSRPSPMLKDFLITGFGLAFTNPVPSTQTPFGWTNHLTGAQASWLVENTSYWQVRPYDVEFEVCGPLTNYTVGPGTVTMSLTLYEFSGHSRHVSENIVGYWNAPVLIPSSNFADPFEPSILHTNLTFLDPEILSLLQSNNALTGIRFKAPYSGTYRVEGSSAMQNWLGISYLYGHEGTNVWTSESDLRAFGNFFRLHYVGEGQIPETNLPPLNVSQPASQKFSAGKSVKTEVAATATEFKVTLNSEIGKKYRIEVLEDSTTIWTRNIIATSSVSVATIPRAGLPAFGMIRAIETE